VIRLKPRHAAAHTNLGAILLRLGKKRDAIDQYQHALTLDADNDIARFLLDAVKGRHNIRSAPINYVKNLFDNYAVQYDQHLIQNLQYSLPSQLRDCYDELMKSDNKVTCLDLGCGTGLVGEAFKQRCSYLVGIDVSENMLTQARYKNIYDGLTHVDIHDYTPPIEGGFDLVIAAEVFSYIGDLENTLKKCREFIANDGVLLFSVEESRDQDVNLQESARFAHRLEYIINLAEKLGYEVLINKKISGRLQENTALAEIIFALKIKN